MTTRFCPEFASAGDGKMVIITLANGDTVRVRTDSTSTLPSELVHITGMLSLVQLSAMMTLTRSQRPPVISGKSLFADES